MPQEQFGEENCPATICIEIDIEDGDPIFHTVWIWKNYGHKSSHIQLCVSMIQAVRTSHAWLIKQEKLGTPRYRNICYRKNQHTMNGKIIC